MWQPYATGAVTLLVLACSSLAQANTIKLTTDNFGPGLAGKSGFIKFHAPWCGHCKRLAPTWDALAKEYENVDYLVIGSVDCVAEESQPLCRKFGIRGYPTLKYFTEKTDTFGGKYEGDRDIEALKRFVQENLGPPCAVAMQDHCSEEQKAAIEGFQAMSHNERTEERDRLQVQVDEADKAFDTSTEELMQLQDRLNREQHRGLSPDDLQQFANLQRENYKLAQAKDALGTFVKPRLRLLKEVIENKPLEKSWSFF